MNWGNTWWTIRDVIWSVWDMELRLRRYKLEKQNKKVSTIRPDWSYLCQLDLSLATHRGRILVSWVITIVTPPDPPPAPFGVSRHALMLACIFASPVRAAHFGLICMGFLLSAKRQVTATWTPS